MTVKSAGFGWREVALLVASILLTLFLAEAGLRILYLSQDTGSLEDLAKHGADLPPPGEQVELGDVLVPSPFPRLIYQLKPKLDVRLKEPRVQTSSAGWREEEISLDKPPGTLRIVGLGDSVMFGWRVEVEERYLDVLEELLNARTSSSSIHWQTMALAVPGYNLVMEVEALRRYGLPVRPDLIVYGYVGNDLCLPNFVAPRRSIWTFDSFLKLYLGQGKISPELVNRRDVVLNSTDGPEATDPRGRSLEEFRSIFCSPENVPTGLAPLVGMDAFEQALRDLAEIGRELGIPVVFLNYGRGRLDVLERIPEGILRVDLATKYRDYLEEHGYATAFESDLILSPEDPHPSPKAHRLIAEWLLEDLEETGTIETILERQRTQAEATR